MTKDVVTLEMLPYNLLQSEESFEWEGGIIKSRCGLEKAQAVLMVIEEFDAMKMGAGRKRIEDMLQQRGIILSEGEIRGILILLNELGMTSSSIGRRGTEITAKGEFFMKWLNNR